MRVAELPAQAQVFRLARATRIIYGVMAPLLLLMGVGLPAFGADLLIRFGGIVGGTDWPLAAMFGFFLLYGVAMTLTACRLFGHTRTRLILSDAGVTYDTFWETLHTDWGDDPLAEAIRRYAPQLGA